MVNDLDSHGVLVRAEKAAYAELKRQRKGEIPPRARRSRRDQMIQVDRIITSLEALGSSITELRAEMLESDRPLGAAESEQILRRFRVATRKIGSLAGALADTREDREEG